MRVVKHSALVRYWEDRPEARAPLTDWYVKTIEAAWSTPADVRATFPQADFVRVASGNTVYVFNVGRAHRRLVAAIHFDFPRVFVLRLMSHREYDGDRWKDEL